MAKIKKKNLSEMTHQKRAQQKKKTLNPFEVHINKDKQKVLGRKSKADRGLPGVARAKAINKRKGTLLQEYKLKNKDNVFLDKRIGEKNSAMSQEEKIMARFAAERVKAHSKKNIFNLNDEEILTHRGQTLEEIEKFDDPNTDDEFSDGEDRSGKLDKTFTGTHFGGGVLSQSESSMSRKDLIEQLIAESKKRKAERQKIREQTMDLTEKLDTEWKDLLPIVSASKKSPNDPVEKTKADDYDMAVRELKFEARGNPTEKLKSEEEIIKEEKERLEALEADRLARMKGFVNKPNEEIRHKSADDLDDGFAMEAIDEEVQDDDTQKLAEVEGDNVNNDDTDDAEEEEEEGEEDEEDEEKEEKEDEEDEEKEEKEEEEVEEEEEHEDDDGDKEGSGQISTAEKKYMNSEKADGKEVNAEKTVNGTVEVNTEQGESNDETEDNESNDESSDEDDLSDLKASDSSSEDESMPKKKNVKFSESLTRCTKDKNTAKQGPVKSILKTDKDEETDPKRTMQIERTEQDIREDLLRRKVIMEQARKELPYTYPAPVSFEELENLLVNQQPDYQSVIIDRIIKCNHWSLGKDNKDKLANLFIYIIQHLNNYAIVSEEEEVIRCFNIFDRLCPYLYDLAQGYPENARICMKEVIKEKHEDFERNKKKYPDLDTLIFFKLVSLLFPTSDFRHPVVTPCLTFMSQILVRSRVKTRTDVAKGLFICTLILEYTTLSKRFSPAVINFLRGIIYTATPKLMIKGIKTIPPFKSGGELSNLLLTDEDPSNMEIDPKVPLMKARDLIEEDLDDDFKIRALLTAVNLIDEFQKQLSELEAVYSIFEPIIKLLKLHCLDRYPKNVRQHIKNIQKNMEALGEKKLEYIVMEKKRPKPLRMYEPRIETVYDGKKHKPMSKEKAEREKLLHKYKKEKKGALREIRRDRMFLAKVQIKQQLKSDAERKRKVQEIFGEAAMQQSELKKMKKKKK